MPYALIKQYDSQHTHIKFDGPFQGKTVTWDTRFFTLNSYSSQENIKNKCTKQFIDIEPGESNIMKLTVALNIAEITEPNIQKMMIMIKQYKHLKLGLHEYG